MKQFILFSLSLALNTRLCSSRISVGDLFPFGTSYGDLLVPQTLDGASPIVNLVVPFPFFNSSNTQLYVNNNGLISFQQPLATYVPNCKESNFGARLIAPFWADADTRDDRNATIWYRQSNDSSLLANVSAQITIAFPDLPIITPVFAFVATWVNVTYYVGGACPQLLPPFPSNTYQALLATDGRASFVIYNYNKLDWSASADPAVGGNCSGLGGISAKVGFGDVGVNATLVTVPGSCTQDVLTLTDRSNVGIAGKWIFRVDQAKIETAGGCEMPRLSNDDVDFTSTTCSTQSTTTTTFATPTSMLTTPTIATNFTDQTRNCACRATGIWLDIIVVIDSSLGMTQVGLNQIKSQLTAIFAGSARGAIEISTDPRVSRLAIVNFAGTASIWKNFAEISSPQEAIDAINGIPFLGTTTDVDIYSALEIAKQMFSGTDPRRYAKNVVLLCASAYDAGGANDPDVAAAQLKNNGVEIITVSYQAGTDLSSISSNGYNFTNLDDSLNSELLHAFCDINCFCPQSWIQFVVNTTTSTTKYGECVQLNPDPTTWVNARSQCGNFSSQSSSLANCFNQNKNDFLKDQSISAFHTPNIWIGLHELNSQYVWDIVGNSSLPLSYSDWYADYPNDSSGAKQCIANVVISGFVSKWRNFPCDSFFEAAYRSFCQISACDTDNFCP